MYKFITKILILATILSFFPVSIPVKAGLLSRPPTNLGLVGYWPMDEGVGTQAGDFSGQKNNGTITGATWTNGKHGKGLSFDGNLNYASAPDNSIYNFGVNSFTVSAWVKLSPTCPANGGLVSKMMSNFTTGWYLRCASGTIVQFYVRSAVNEFQYPAATVPSNQWIHVVGMSDRSSNKARIFVNGAEVGSGASIAGYGTFDVGANSALFIGAMRSSASYHAAADIDDVRIYNRALTAGEIFKLYSSGATKLTKVSNSGLVGYWPMDEGRGNQVGDSSGKGNTGNITGATWTNGERGKALSFDGNDYVEMGTASLNINDKMSVSAWVKASADTNGRIVSKHGTSNYGWMLTRSAASDLFEWRISTNGSDWNGGESSYNSFVIGQWYHVVSVYDGSFMRIYINGREDTTGQFPFALSGNVNNSNGRTLIAKADWPGGNLFSGLIDDVRIYNRALTATEIQSLYKQNSTTLGTSYENRLTNGLVGFWTMNGKDISGTTVLDKSGQGNNGTLTNMTATSSTAIGKLGQALSFDKVDDGLNVGSAAVLDNLTALSYCAWIKPNTFGQLFIGAIVSKGFTKYFGITDLNKLNFTVQYDGTDLSIYSTSNIIYRTWSHVCATWSGGASTNNATLYINGSSVAVTGSDGTGSPSYDGSSICYVGNIGSTRTFDGLIDEVRIYNRALSADEVKQLYKMGQ